MERGRAILFSGITTLEDFPDGVFTVVFLSASLSLFVFRFSGMVGSMFSVFALLSVILGLFSVEFVLFSALGLLLLLLNSSALFDVRNVFWQGAGVFCSNFDVTAVRVGTEDSDVV